MLKVKIEQVANNNGLDFDRASTGDEFFPLQDQSYSILTLSALVSAARVKTS